MSKNFFLDAASSYCSGNPSLLASLLEALAYPKDIPADVALGTLKVANGTELPAVLPNLPSQTTFMVGDVPVSVSLTWDNVTAPTYVPTTAGSYVLKGTFGVLPTYITNTSGKRAIFTIAVNPV